MLISLRHPNVVEVYDAGVAQDGSVYIVMEKLEGKSLREIIVRLGKLSVLEALPIAIQVASGVLAAHARKVIHRDLKPDNVFVGPDGTVKVLDFGIAKYLERSFDTTQKRIWQGTPSYMAPEQFQGLPVSYRSDVFALGVILYELIGGIKPSHIGGDPTSVEQFAIRQLAVDPPLLHKLDDSVPASTSRMIRRAIAKSSEDRFDMAEFLKKMQVELHNERKRSNRRPPRDLIRACLDVTDPDCMPAFTAFSQRQTRPVGAVSTNDPTPLGLGLDEDADSPFASSRPRVITERLSTVAPLPTRTAPHGVGKDGERRTNTEPVFSRKVVDVARARFGSSGWLFMAAAAALLGLLVGVGLGILGIRKQDPVETTAHTSTSTSAVSNREARATATPPPVAPAVANRGISAVRIGASATTPSPSPPPAVASAHPSGNVGAERLGIKPHRAVGSSKAPSPKRTTLRRTVAESSETEHNALLRVGSGLTDETAPVVSGRKSAAAATTPPAPKKGDGRADQPAPRARTGKLWFPPK